MARHPLEAFCYADLNIQPPVQASSQDTNPPAETHMSILGASTNTKSPALRVSQSILGNAHFARLTFLLRIPPPHLAIDLNDPVVESHILQAGQHAKRAMGGVGRDRTPSHIRRKRSQHAVTQTPGHGSIWYPPSQKNKNTAPLDAWGEDLQRPLHLFLLGNATQYTSTLGLSALTPGCAARVASATIWVYF